VTATSHTDGWAVGQLLGSTGATHSQTAILHWNGSRWARVASPGPGIATGLFAVAASSASNAWALRLYDEIGHPDGDQLRDRLCAIAARCA
jgi:hypothetical protein